MRAGRLAHQAHRPMIEGAVKGLKPMNEGVTGVAPA